MLTGFLEKNWKNSSWGLRHTIWAFVFFALAFPVLSASAQQRGKDPWWLTLEEGKRFFRNGEYGEALRRFENARDARKNRFAALERDFITVLSIHQVRRFKDDLGLVELYIQKEYRTAAAAALAELYHRVPREKLGNSASKALTELGRLKEYPDAEYWIGESYRAEGEYGVALAQFQKAYDNRNLLENPGFGTEILYKMADLYRLRGEEENMAAKLEEILLTDPSWSRESFARSAMVQSAANNGMDRFLVLYRNNKAGLEKAHRLLGRFYYASGRHNRAMEHFLRSFLIQNTVIIEKLKEERYDYSFTTLPALMNSIEGSERSLRRLLETYMADSEYYRTLYYLANSFYGNGQTPRAREIWAFLRNNGPEEWRDRSIRQLARPALEGTVGAEGENRP
jgi:tetratricopeptide (TPR) repeat protein